MRDINYNDESNTCETCGRDCDCECSETLDAWEYQKNNKELKCYDDDGDEQGEHDKQYNG